MAFINSLNLTAILRISLASTDHILLLHNKNLVCKTTLFILPHEIYMVSDKI